MALIELVKNSFDADAATVLIRFHGPLNPGQGSVEVWDDGHGMDADAVENSWLDIATDAKKRRTRSESGQRRVLGEKGIGRFAASRIAQELLLITRRAGSEEIRLLIDWREFDREDTYLDEIEVVWESGPATVFADIEPPSDTAHAGNGGYKSGHGTLLQLDKLTRRWTPADFEDLRTALARLVRPRPVTKTDQRIEDFKIILELPEEFESLSGEVDAPEELRSPHYRLAGSVDSRGIAQFKFTQLDPPVDEVMTDKRLWPSEDREPQAGPIDLDIQVWDRDRDAIAKVSGARGLTDFRRLLDRVAGVSVYRDGFRVLPFGEVGDDWLGLDRRRVQNPTMRVSNNQVIGHVFIGADENEQLRDQTNREGLLEGQAYEDLRVLLSSALAEIEQKRYTARRPTDTSKQSRSGLFERFELKDIRNALAHQYPSDRGLIDLVDAKDEEIKEGVHEVQRVLSQYSRLATLGSLVDRVLHDGRTAVSRLKNIVRFGERDLAKTTVSAEVKLETVANSIRDTSIQADLLGTLFNQIEPFSGRKRGRPRVVSLRGIAQDAVAILLHEAEESGVKIDIVGDGIDVRVDPSEIITVIVNLVQNALYWLSTTPVNGERKLVILLERVDSGTVSIIVSDSGPGVPEDFREIIFDPYFSGRPDGIGLGLSIAGNIVEALYDGQLTLLDGGPLGGATFQAILKRRV